MGDKIPGSAEWPALVAELSRLEIHFVDSQTLQAR